MMWKKIIFGLLILVGTAELSHSTGQSIIVSPPILLDSTAVRHPWILMDTGGILLYCETAFDSGNHLIQYRIADPTSADQTAKNSFMFGGKPHMPVVHQAGNKKVLFWNEDVNIPPPIPYSSMTIQPRLVLFEGDFPGEVELISRHDFDYVYYNIKLIPGAALIDSLLYFDRCDRISWSDYDNPMRFRLGCLNLESNQLTPTDTSLWTNGQTALMAVRDTLIWITSNIWCSGFTNNHECSENEGSYVVHSLFGGHSVRDSVIEQGPSLLFRGWYDNVISARADSDFIVALNLAKKIYQVDGSDGAPSPLISLDDLPWLSSWMSTIHPLQTPTANCVFVVPNESVSQFFMLVYDRHWNFVDSQTITLEDKARDISRFMYEPESDKIVFAYSAVATDTSSSSRLFLQSVKLDIVTDVADEESSLPSRFSLSQNYPNPFNPSTQIEFSLATRSHVELTVYNVLGQRVRTLADGLLPAGKHIATWDGTNSEGSVVASGIYFCRLESAGKSQTIKMTLQK